MRRYIFEPYTSKSKITCPNCGKRKEFTRLIDTKTGELLPLPFGACSRAIKCGWMKFPAENEVIESTGVKIAPEEKKDYYNILPYNLVEQSLRNQFNDNFSKWCIKIFGEERSKKVLSDYMVGCYGKYCNTVFWQIDDDNQIRSGKIINYNVKTGKRGKYITWMHSQLKIEGYSLQQAFFGSHLLNKYPDKRIGFVEGEKNAIVANIMYPNLLWLAGGQIYCMQEYRLNVLKGRKILVYPDKGAKEYWESALKKINPILNLDYQISDAIERDEDLKIGDDITDYVLKNNLHKNLAV